MNFEESVRHSIELVDEQLSKYGAHNMILAADTVKNLSTEVLRARSGERNSRKLLARMLQGELVQDEVRVFLSEKIPHEVDTIKERRELEVQNACMEVIEALKEGRPIESLIMKVVDTSRTLEEFLAELE